MCDTLCVMPAWSKSRNVLFAKNSDRSPNEPHYVIWQNEKHYAPGSLVKLTYITIPRAEYTHGVLLCKPSWTWGAEMGINTASVAIGNEAVFTKTKRGEPALTGMDLIRLALERSDNARHAVQCMTELLERYGQGGNCGFDHEFFYDNSFIIADPKTGYVLETSGKKWVAKEFKDYQAISNRLCIHKEHTLRGGVDEAYDFTGKLTEPVYTYFSGSAKRRKLSLRSLSSPADAKMLMTTLRQHNPSDASKVFTHGSVSSICMHAGGIVGDHTTGSIVAELREGKPATIWCTGSSTPCISTFKPVFLTEETIAPVFDNDEASKKYWLEREKLHRSILAGTIDITDLQMKRDSLEKQFLEEEHKLFTSGTPSAGELNDFARNAAAREQQLVNEFLPQAVISMPDHNRFQRYWIKKNKELSGQNKGLL